MGAAEPPTSTLGEQADRDARDRAATRHEPSDPKTVEGLENDPRAGGGLEKGAAAGVDDVPPEEVHALELIGSLNAAGAHEELAEVAPVSAGEENGGEADESDASRFMDVPDDGPYQEVVHTNDIVQGSEKPTQDEKHSDELRPGDEALGAPAAENEPPYSSSEENVAVEVPDDAINIEVLATEHVEGFRASLVPEDIDQPTDILEVVEATENDQDAAPKYGHVEGFEAPLFPEDRGQPNDMPDVIEATENDQDAAPKYELSIEVPNDTRYREVLMAEHVEGFGDSLAQHDGGPRP